MPNDPPTENSAERDESLPSGNGEILPIRVSELVKRHGYVTALDGVSLEIDGGESIAVLGRNGAGKTTLLRLLVGLLTPDSGDIRFGGFNIRQHREKIRGRTGFYSHQSLLYPELSVAENLRFAARLFGIEGAEGRIEKALDGVGMLAWQNELVRCLSDGMRRRVALARAVLHRPRTLVLDEPFVGLDSVAVEWVGHTLETQKAHGGACIFATHRVEESLARATRVIILDRGRVRLDQPLRGGDRESLPAELRRWMGETK